MVELNFIVNPYYVVVEGLRKYPSPFKEWKKFKVGLYKEFKEEYNFAINPNVRAYCIYINSDLDLEKARMGSLIPLFKKVFENECYNVLIKQTEDYKKKVESLWEKNKNVYFSLYEEIMGMKIPEITIDVSLINPNYNTGFACPKSFPTNPTGKNIISWGHPLSETLPNYDSIYLGHEILHIIFDLEVLNANNDYLFETFHALIELFADNEYRIRLNGGRYFEWETHEHLIKWEKKIYPYWIFFINRNYSDILDKVKYAFERDKKNYDVEEYYNVFLRFNFKDMNILDFWKFIRENKIVM